MPRARARALLCVLTAPTAIGYAVIPAPEHRRATLSTGCDMEWLRQRPPAGTPPQCAPILFVHGTFHGGWCWAEHWMRHFAAELGCVCHAVSLRGTSGSPCPDGAVKVRIGQHVDDLRAFVDGPLAADTGGAKPVLIGHSFGGAYLLKYLENGGQASASVLLCSVPPTGNGPMTTRFVLRSPRRAWLVTRGFALKSAARSASDARALFFDEDLPAETVQRHLGRFAKDSQCGLDLGDFLRNLPATAAVDGVAPWIGGAGPVLVVGAEQDAVVDIEAVQETAAFVGSSPATVLSGLPHDVMLATEWRRAAEPIIEWLR